MIDTMRAEYPRDMVRAAHQPGSGAVESWARDLFDSLESYARDNPAQAALWAFGIGFVLGWKLKPW